MKWDLTQAETVSGPRRHAQDTRPRAAELPLPWAWAVEAQVCAEAPEKPRFPESSRTWARIWESTVDARP